MTESKKQLRQHIRRSIGQLSPEDIHLQSQAIWGLLEQEQAFLWATNIGLYWSMDSEVSTHSFIDKWSKDKNIYLPVIQGNNITFTPYYGKENMSQNQYGILEPSLNNQPSSTLDLIIVPAMGYDASGHRLGHGGGYYDRYFSLRQQTSSLPKNILGVCFSCQLLEQVPSEEFDFDVETIITPSHIIHTRP